MELRKAVRKFQLTVLECGNISHDISTWLVLGSQSLPSLAILEHAAGAVVRIESLLLWINPSVWSGHPAAGSWGDLSSRIGKVIVT